MTEHLNIEIVPTVPAHLRELAGHMQDSTIEMAKKLGLTPRKALWRSFKQSLFCKTAIINGKVGAIWGVAGALFSEVGQPWLVMSPDVEEYPMRVAFAYRREMREMQKMFPVLEDYVDETNHKAIRLLELMGFKLDKNEITLGDAVLRRAVRRA